MSMQDTIADMFTHIRNGQQAKKAFVTMPPSKVKTAIAKVLKDEGYIVDYMTTDAGKLTVTLKYYMGKPVIEKIRRVSKSALRVYKDAKSLPRVMGGLGISIISTPQGIMSDRAARAAGQGGEVIGVVS
ncbi:MAG: 30S ribosomal protein S8 [Gammaproteobacteria bacterium]